ncbi:LysM peptidoglycan-binding domain-containing protein [Adhaeribacter swui]|uniref:LysM peptidoglycan-binding domain-containing protein n=1 Tax=Adhaeribacter swui TaxID=2086471 RepID=A0A7G7G2Q7_9BACT|nr:lytic transglycosylase domain-containing protein [Adhaeribacter swui]QNF31441.1 LysM peptidoglycan-binding domain-containing protein [Adhaeribacter swui]
MRNTLLLLLFCLFNLAAQAQTVVVPNNVYFADQRLIINEDARKAIQKQVDALLKYPLYFQAKVDRADTYFPIISRIFAEEGLPDDFKYLALQESGLVSDAVSTSNAVGFWQFKKEAAADHGLLITPDVDERKHIVNSSRGAAKYFVKSNTLYYKNWYNTLLSYYLGFTGAKAYAKPEHVDSKEMEVNSKTNWYILTFLAHKIAFENFIGKNPAPTVVLQEVPVSVGQSLSDVALATQTDYAEIQKYNKWLNGSVVPGNKPYVVLVPVTNPNQQQAVLAANKAQAPVAVPGKTNVPSAGPAVVTTSNGLKAIIARTGDSVDKLAKAGKINAKRFRQYNDMTNHEGVRAGATYYLERKHSKANTAYYATASGEQIWDVAQKFGVKVKSLLWYNRLRKNENLLAGRVIWLQQRRPGNVPVEYQENQPETPQPEAPEKPLIIANNAPVVASPNKPATSSAPVAKKTVEDKLANIFGVKPNPEPKAPIKTQPIEVDENLADVNEETAVPEAIATAPVIPNAPSKPEVETDPTMTTADSVNDPLLVAETSSDNDLEVEISTDTTLASTNNQAPALTESSAAAAKTESLYPAKKNAASSPVADATIFKTEPATANKSRNLPDSAKAPAPGRNEHPISVIITEHVVSKGETFYSISRLYDIPVDQLQAWNNLTNLSLAIGQTLRLTPPAGTSTPKTVATAPAPVITAAAMPPVTERSMITNAVTTHHIVSSGESMYQISRKYGVTIKEIMEWNKKADFSVSPGEKLTIKPKSSSRN